MADVQIFADMNYKGTLSKKRYRLITCMLLLSPPREALKMVSSRPYRRIELSASRGIGNGERREGRILLVGLLKFPLALTLRDFRN